MTRLEKTLARLLSRPVDFTWEELKAVMASFGYMLKTTGGSGRKFIHAETKVTLFMHEPHPLRVLKAYQVRDVIKLLRQERRIP